LKSLRDVFGGTYSVAVITYEVKVFTCRKLHSYAIRPTEDITRAFQNAETKGINVALQTRQQWYNARGKWLPVLCTEMNLDWDPDIRIQKMEGAVWLALVFRAMMLQEFHYNVYFEFTGKPGDLGLGMIRAEDCLRFYPYYVNWMMGRNISVEDAVFEANTTSDDVKVIAWNHQGKLNILLICKVDVAQTVNLQGVTGQLEAIWIDNTIPYTNPALQTAILNAENPITLNGYAVMLLQSTQSTPVSPSPLLLLALLAYFLLG